jgi:hypothetical protein
VNQPDLTADLLPGLRPQYAFTSMTTKRELVERVYANVESGKAPMVIEVQMGASPSEACARV